MSEIIDVMYSNDSMNKKTRLFKGWVKNSGKETGFYTVIKIQYANTFRKHFDQFIQKTTS